MKTTIYYFSATGNNLSIAKKLASKLGEVELKSIPASFDKNITIEGSRVGFIFPIYAWGMPRMVREFLEKVRFGHVDYIFGITGCGGHAGKTMVRLQQLLKKKGQNLNAGFIVKEPSNGINVDNDSLMHKVVVGTRGDRPQMTIDERMEEISQAVVKMKPTKMEKEAAFSNYISNAIHNLAEGIFKTADKDYWVNDACTGCGQCTKLCPRANIVMEASKPTWHGNCENCTACMHGCVNDAIQFGELTEGKKRYRKEGINVKELYI